MCIDICRYASPVGNLLLGADENALIGLWLDETEKAQRYLRSFQKPICEKGENAVLLQTEKWLDDYFDGKKMTASDAPRLCPAGSKFARHVWKILMEIPYGKTVSYGDIALQIARERNIPKMSAQAVGGAVGNNPISIIIPCHRVIRADGSLGGYGWGGERKRFLIDLEQKHSPI